MVTSLVLVVAVVASIVSLPDASPMTLAVIRLFAGGAILTTLADTTMPEAIEEGGPTVAIATAIGFLSTFSLTLV